MVLYTKLDAHIMRAITAYMGSRSSATQQLWLCMGPYDPLIDAKVI